MTPKAFVLSVGLSFCNAAGWTADPDAILKKVHAGNKR